MKLFSPSSPRTAARGHRARGGFTLIEAALATVIVGVGCVSLLQLLATGTANNAEARSLATGMNLARNIRELTMRLPLSDPDNPSHWGTIGSEGLGTFDDIKDLDGQMFSPPIDGRQQPLSGLDSWQQEVVVHSVDIDRLTLDVPNGTHPAARVTATIKHNGIFVYSMTWYAFEKIVP